MKTKSIVTWGALALVVTATSVVSVESVSAQSFDGPRYEQGEGKGIKQRFKQRKRRGHAFGQNVEKSVVELSNGVEMTLTTNDSETLTKMHERADKMLQRSRDGFAVEKLENGIKIVRTSDDEEKVAKMHERAEKMKLKNTISKSVEKLENGIVITKTSSNTDAVAWILEKADRYQDRDGVTVVTLSNGVQITRTSDDESKVERLHAYADRVNGQQ